MHASRIRATITTWACLLAPPLIATAARAQAPPEDAASTPAGTPAAAPPSAFSVQLNLDFTNAYFFHGILQQDQGLIIQPAVKLTMNAYQHDDLKVDVVLGTWNSFGENGGTQSSDLTKDWYESDLIFGVVLAKGAMSLTTTYTFFASPSDAYQTVQELDFTFAYDESALLGKFALHPYALLGIETGADASDGADSNNGVYLEIGLAPGFSFDVGKTPVAVSFPLSVGLSVHDYYQNAAGNDSTFGYFQMGAKASIPLPIGDRYGKWTVNAGLYGLFLGSQTEEFNHGDDAEFIATLGLQLNF